jgi:hypothetical protein
MNRIDMMWAAILVSLLGSSIMVSNGQQRSVTMGGFVKMIASRTNAARVDYMGSCDATSPNRIIRPHVVVKNANSSLHGLGMVQAMLGNTRDVAVGQSAGVIHVRIGTVDESILHSHIRSVALTPDQRYDPSEAIWALENSSDFQLEMRNRSMRVELMQGGLESFPAEGEPHLPSTMRNLTVDEVLSEIARTFSGTVVYGECRHSNGQSLIGIRFVGH